jgi:hypothetical protein
MPAALAGEAAGGAAGAAGAGASSAVSASPGLEPRQGRVGDRFRLTVEAGGTEAGAAQPDESYKPGAKLGPFRVLDADASRPGELALTLTPEDTGELEIPAFEVRFRSAAGTERLVAVAPVKTTIASVLPKGDEGLADLKGPVDLPVPIPWRAILLAALGTLAVAAALWYAGRLWKRARNESAKPEDILPPGMTADVWVRQELDRLLAERLIESGQLREFHIRLADLVRQYLELRFRIPALERTTEEVGEEMRHALIPSEPSRLTVNLLACCDRVKFAKFAPERSEIEEEVALTRRIIDLTVPPPPAQAGSGALERPAQSAA